MTDTSVAVGVDVGGTKVLAVALGPTRPPGNTAPGLAGPTRPPGHMAPGLAGPTRPPGHMAPGLAGREGATPVGENRRPTPDTAGALVDAIADAARDAAGDAGAVVGALCVGVPGLVDEHGVMRFGANLPGILEQPLRDVFGERFGVPVLIDNDANVAAWGERVAGGGEGSAHMLMVTLGTGVGGGIVLNGELYRGAHGMAGEIGHFVVQLDGEPCPCGQRGCWERYASGSALGRIAREAGFESGEAVVAAAGDGDDAARGVLDTFTRWVAIGLAGFANTFDPERIVLGGGLVEIGDLLFDPLRAHFRRLIEGGDHRAEVPILPATLGERAGAIGAALLARDLLA